MPPSPDPRVTAFPQMLPPSTSRVPASVMVPLLLTTPPESSSIVPAGLLELDTARVEEAAFEIVPPSLSNVVPDVWLRVAPPATEKVPVLLTLPNVIAAPKPRIRW